MCLIDFLMDGTLHPFNITDTSTHAAALDLYDLADALDCRTARDAVLARIGEVPATEIEAFLVLAEHVYKVKDGKPKHSPESPLGQLMKEQLKSFLPMLIQTGKVEAVKGAGETLSKQLVEVMVENWGVLGAGGMTVKPEVVKLEEQHIA